MSFDSLLADIRSTERQDAIIEQKKRRRENQAQNREFAARIKQASLKSVASEKSPIQIEYEEQENARQASMAAERLTQQQLAKQQTEYAHTKPAAEAHHNYREQLAIDQQQPQTSYLSAFSLGPFNPDTKQFQYVKHYTLEIQQAPPLPIKNSEVKEARAGKVLVVSAKRRYGDQKVVQLNTSSGIPKFTTASKPPHDKIILPVRLTEHKENVRVNGSEVNDMLLHGQKEISESDPLITAICSSHEMDTRLVHNYLKEKNSSSIVNAKKKLSQEPRTVIEYTVPHKGCGQANCPFCYSAAEMGTILDYQSQQSVFL
jgi:hypothetical protein